MNSSDADIQSLLVGFAELRRVESMIIDRNFRTFSFRNVTIPPSVDKRLLIPRLRDNSFRRAVSTATESILIIRSGNDRLIAPLTNGDDVPAYTRKNIGFTEQQTAMNHRSVTPIHSRFSP